MVLKGSRAPYHGRTPFLSDKQQRHLTPRNISRDGACVPLFVCLGARPEACQVSTCKISFNQHL
eukprot:6504933-Pyramimonas_sp.AAC.1